MGQAAVAGLDGSRIFGFLTRGCQLTVDEAPYRSLTRSKQRCVNMDKSKCNAQGVLREFTQRSSLHEETLSAPRPMPARRIVLPRLPSPLDRLIAENRLQEMSRCRSSDRRYHHEAP